MSQASIDNAKRPREEAAPAPAIKHAKTTPPADDTRERVWWDRVMTADACKDWSLLHTFTYLYRDDSVLTDAFSDSTIYPTNCPEFDADRVGYCDKLIAMYEEEEKEPLEAADKRCAALVTKYMRNYYAASLADDASPRAPSPTSEGLHPSVCTGIRVVVEYAMNMGDSEGSACRGVAYSMLRDALKYAKEYNVSREAKKEFQREILEKIHGLQEELKDDANTTTGVCPMDRASKRVELMQCRRLNSLACDDLRIKHGDMDGIHYITRDEQGTFEEDGVYYCNACCGANSDGMCLVCDDQADKCNCFKQDQSMPAKKRRFTCRCT